MYNLTKRKAWANIETMLPLLGYRVKLHLNIEY